MVYASWGRNRPRGASFFTAKNPEFDYTFTYYLKEGMSSRDRANEI